MVRRGKFKIDVALMSLLFFVLLIGACGTASKKDLPGKPGSVAGFVQSDTAIFHEGFSWLGTSGKPADYDRAGDVFSQLIKVYPKSKWRSYAETYLKLLDDLKKTSVSAAANRLEAKKAQTEIDELRVSMDQSKKYQRLLQEKFQSETARLQQENEQFKHDIQRLKQLEIELQRRDRSVR